MAWRARHTRTRSGPRRPRTAGTVPAMSRQHNRPRSRPPSRPGRPRRPRDEAPDLLDRVRFALDADHPLPLVTLAAAIVESTAHHDANPFTPEPKRATRREMIQSLTGVDLPETTALLTAIAPLLEGEPGGEEVRRELAHRSHRLPDWLTGLTPARVTRVMSTTHPFHDGENVMAEVLTDGGSVFTVLVYVDHNLGTLVKDALAIPTDLDDVRASLLAHADDPELVMVPLDPAAGRARVEQAIESALRTFPPFESENWPMSRPLVEWVCRLLPPGGVGYSFEEWDEAARADLEQRFRASPHADGLDADHLELIDSLLWFGCDYGICEPLNWSPPRAEIFLLDWVPRKLLLGERQLRKMPGLLRSFVRFGHAEIGLRDDLTAETLAAIDRFEPAYRAALTGDRPHNILDVLAAAGIGTGEEPAYDPTEHLERKVGGRDALDTLDDRALPDEEVRWEHVPEDIHPRFAEVLELCDAFCERWLDAEHRTAVRRLAARVAAADPGVFGGTGRTDTAAAALCWIVGKANRAFDHGWGKHGSLLVKDLMEWFGITASPSTRAARMLRAIDVDDRWFSIYAALGDPALLVSSERRAIIEHRGQREERGW